MATVQVVYTWSEGACLSAAIDAKAMNVEALADMRIEAKRLFTEALTALNAVDAAGLEAPSE